MTDDGLIREITIIRRLAQQNVEEDWRFRSYIKTRLNLSNAELDAVVYETTDEVWSGIDCTTCAHCCKSLEIELGQKDITRLAQHLQLTTRKFAETYLRTTEDGAKVFASRPCSFLGDDNRCSVYEHRPESCRGYPFLYKEDFRGRTIGVLERVGDCPIAFNVWDRLKRRFGGGATRGKKRKAPRV